MQIINNALADKLLELLELRSEIELLENKYTSLLKADEPLESLKVSPRPTTSCESLTLPIVLQ